MRRRCIPHRLPCWVPPSSEQYEGSNQMLAFSLWIPGGRYLHNVCCSNAMLLRLHEHFRPSTCIKSWRNLHESRASRQLLRSLKYDTVHRRKVEESSVTYHLSINRQLERESKLVLTSRNRGRNFDGSMDTRNSYMPLTAPKANRISIYLIPALTSIHISVKSSHMHMQQVFEEHNDSRLLFPERQGLIMYRCLLRLSTLSLGNRRGHLFAIVSTITNCEYL
jgi:hypothetical protein